MKSSEKAPWKPSIELKKVRSLLKTEDPMLLVIRGHLLLEHVLISFIQTGLTKASALKIDRLNFPAKTELAIAMGLLPENLSGALLYVNKLRNDFAHNLDFQIAPAIREEFILKFPPHGRALLLKDENDNTKDIPSDKVRIGRFFEILFVLLDLTRHQYSEWLKHKIEAEQKLQEALANLEKVEQATGVKKVRTSP